MSLIKLELDKRKPETQYINMMIRESYEALRRELTNKEKIAKEVLFCTPEEAEAVVLRNTNFEKVKCRIDDRGFAYFEVKAKIRKDIMSPMSPMSSTATIATDYLPASSFNTSTTSTATTNQYYNGSNSNLYFAANSAVDSSYITAALSKLKLKDGDEVKIELPNGAVLDVKADGSYKVFGCDGSVEHNSHTIKQGQEVSFDLPNGAKLEVKRDGSIEVIDANAKVVYKACSTREFNRFINASDLLQEFIIFLGTLGVKQGQVLNIPIELFINWLVFKAAEQDHESPPSNLTPPESHPRLLAVKERANSPKCLCCGRFIRKDVADKGFNFCDGSHASRFAEKLSLAS